MLISPLKGRQLAFSRERNRSGIIVSDMVFENIMYYCEMTARVGARDAPRGRCSGSLADDVSTRIADHEVKPRASKTACDRAWLAP